MTESQLQKKIMEKYEADGWYVIRLRSTNKVGISDLLCLKDKAKPLFIEVKSPENGGKVSQLQRYRMRELRGYGFDTDITASLDQYDCNKEIRCAKQCDKCKETMTQYP